MEINLKDTFTGQRFVYIFIGLLFRKFEINTSDNSKLKMNNQIKTKTNRCPVNVTLKLFQ